MPDGGRLFVDGCGRYGRGSVCDEKEESFRDGVRCVVRQGLLVAAGAGTLGTQDCGMFDGGRFLAEGCGRHSGGSLCDEKVEAFRDGVRCVLRQGLLAAAGTSGT